MEAPHLLEPRCVTRDTWLLGSWMPVPGIGVLPCNAYVVRSREPVLIDTGLAALQDGFLAALERVIDPTELRWIWITHMDPDHVGNLGAVLARAPKARIVTTYLGMGKMGLLGLPQQRAWLLNPGQTLDVGDRGLTAVIPPSFDAPETTGLFDNRTRTCFSADSFGAVQQEIVDDAAQIDAEALAGGMRLWSTVDAPWLALAERSLLRRNFDRIRALAPDLVLGSHLQPARGMTDCLLQCLAESADAPPFVGPDQRAVEAMMASMEAEAV
ncbi:MAG: MBL fold metallo-hydrolase [Candidatus Methylophosphatis roskildensis]